MGFLNYAIVAVSAFVSGMGIMFVIMSILFPSIVWKQQERETTEQ